MKRKKIFIFSGAVILAAAAVLGYLKVTDSGDNALTLETVRAERDTITQAVSTTGVVEPQNRLEIKPPVSGRIDEILVREGDRIRVGQKLALMSSSERAALLDAALEKGEEELAYWKEAYKPTPLYSPIDGEVIVRAVEPGQTVSTSDAILVLSDRLIVSAQVDEIDIGRIKVGQKARITLDAYPDVTIPARVDHIAYESETISNVTIYDVDILPDKVPEVFRSGMSTNVEIIEEEAENILTVPARAVREGSRGPYILVLSSPESVPEIRKVAIGLSDGARTAVLSGLDGDETVVVSENAYRPGGKASEGGGSPFFPSRSRGRKKK